MCCVMFFTERGIDNKSSCSSLAIDLTESLYNYYNSLVSIQC